MLERPPEISVGLPVYNGARYLHAAVEDFLGGTHGDFELILSDNHSTDETEEIGREYARLDRRVRYVRNVTNVGALPNADRAFALARGRFYCLAAYDDRHAPDFLEKLLGALHAAPEAILAYGFCEMIGEEGEAFQFDPAREGFVAPDGTFFPGDRRLERPLPAEPVARYRAVLGSTNVNAPIHGLFRRDSLGRTFGHVLCGSDRLLVAHAALLGPFAFVAVPLFFFRMHGASTYHLSHVARVAREAGPGARVGGVPYRTLLNYARAVGRADLSPAERMAAYGATLGYALRPHALKSALLPGPGSYWGWKGRELVMDRGS